MHPAVTAQIPWSDGAAAADRTARPLIDAFPDDPAVQAIARLIPLLRLPSVTANTGGR